MRTFKLLFAVLLVPLSALADHRPVYKWQDGAGVVHFSSKAPAKDSKPAELPEINRGEVKLAKIKAKTCESHGGINCQAGADNDGSVICTDGFKDVGERFRFSCASPKLQISDISDLSPEGSFSVFVRNAKSVAAQQVAVLYKPGEGRPIKLAGPEAVEPFGVAEYTFKPTPGSARNAAPAAKPGLGEVDISCANCS